MESLKMTLKMTNVLSKFSKIAATCPNSKKKQVGSFLTRPKSAKMTNQASNFKFGQQVNLIYRVPLGTPPQESDIITS